MNKIQMQEAFAQLIVQMREVGKADLKDTAGFQFVNHLRLELVSRGFTDDSAETICARMDVELPNDVLEDEMLAEMAQVYAIILVKARHSLVELGFKNPTEVVANMASKISLKFQ